MRISKKVEEKVGGKGLEGMPGLAVVMVVVMGFFVMLGDGNTKGI